MKALLEQDFDELYAQVEARVKCIKPVKQIDTYTKILMWTSLNEILMDVFGGSRFMWMIDIDETTFTICFVDKCCIVNCKSLQIPYRETFVWPTETELKHMTFEQLNEFNKRVTDAKMTRTDISKHYNHATHWFRNLRQCRARGMFPMDMIPTDKTSAASVVNTWSPQRIEKFRFVYLLHQLDLPKSASIMSSVLKCNLVSSNPHDDVALIKRKSVAIDKFITPSTMVDMRELLDTYIDILIHTLDEIRDGKSNKHTISLSKILHLSKKRSVKMRAKIEKLKTHFQDQKSILDSTIVNQHNPNTKEVEND